MKRNNLLSSFKKASYCLTHIGLDTATNNENNCFTGNAGWTPTVSSRKQIVTEPSIISRFLINVTTNNNTVDGANFLMRTSDTAFSFSNGNIIVIIDQATGIFQDTVNQDVLAANTAFAIRYVQGDNTTVSDVHTILVTPN